MTSASAGVIVSETAACCQQFRAGHVMPDYMNTGSDTQALYRALANVQTN